MLVFADELRTSDHVGARSGDRHVRSAEPADSQSRRSQAISRTATAATAVVGLRGQLSNPAVPKTIERLLSLLERTELDDGQDLRSDNGGTHTHKLVHRLTEDAVSQLIADYRHGVKISDLVLRYGISRQSITTLLRRHGIATRFRQKLSDADVDEAGRLYAAGWSLAKIGQHFGVNDETVRYRLRRNGTLMRGCHDRPRREDGHRRSAS